MTTTTTMDKPGNALLEKKLTGAGNNLLTPSLVASELLESLHLVENLLAEVDQSPPESTMEALVPTTKALVAEELLKHSDTDVKVAVASCISEITRITAPEVPYKDDEMKAFFQLVVSSFENLDDKSSRSYIRRISILETLAKVRSCVVMLDLECYDLIVEMFQHFFRTIRDDHVDGVFSSMETIMTLVVEESEEISVDLLSSLLSVLKKNNKDVLPIARQLAEDVIIKCSSTIKPYLLPALRSSDTSLGDYSKAVADVFLAKDQAVKPAVGDAANNNSADEKDVVNEPSDKAVEVAMETMEDAPPSEVAGLGTVGSSKTVESSGILKKGNEDTPVTNDNSKEANHDSQDEETEPSKTIVDSVADVETPKSKSKPQNSKRRKGRKPNTTKSSLEPFGPVLLNKQGKVHIPDQQEKDGEDDDIQSEDVDAAEAACDENPSEVPAPLPKTSDNAVIISSSFPTGSLSDETQSKKTGGEKKEHPLQEELVSDFDSNKESDTKKDSEGAIGLESALNKCASKKSSSVFDKEENIPSSADETKNEDEKIIELDGTSAKDLVQEADVEGSQHVNKKKVHIKKEVIELDGASAKDLVQVAKVEGSQRVYKKKQGQIKATPGKGHTKTAAKDDKNKTVALPKSTPKANKDENKTVALPKSTPKANKDGSGTKGASKSNSKRKRPGEGKALQTKVCGPELVGARVEVWWPNDLQFYKGVVKSFNNATKEHMVFYDDGDVEVLNLMNEKWNLVADSEGHATDGGSPDGPADETPIGKKAKPSADLGVKQQKTVSSTKKSGAGSSKQKTTPKSGPVLKDDIKIVGKSKGEASKKVGKSDAEKSGKSKPKSKPSKVGTKSSEDASKPAEKSKDDNEDTPKVNIKMALKNLKTRQNLHDKPKDSSKLKDKSSPKTVGKSNPDISGKVQVGPSIVDVEMEDGSLGSGSSLEKSKEKSEGTLKSSIKRKQSAKD